ncbi:MAG: tyrosine-protein phosphatase [Halioglobus sp.]|nr:tyrosine-protein phosphatase [Halioglobus sp.]
MSRKKLFGSFVAVAILAIATIQFIPAPALVIPAELPADQRDAHRLLNFEGIPNFRDLGGYPTADGREVKWGVLYRAGTFAGSSRSDLQQLEELRLQTLIDFRSAAEKEAEPNHLPDPIGFDVVEIPTLDDGNEAMVEEITQRIESGNFDGFDPNALMLDANRQFASTFTPQFRQFMQTILNADGAPVVWHCTAGKDRTGFAAAILLRILGVPQDVVMADYMASKQNALEARSSQIMLLRLFKGDEAADKLSIMLGVEEDWLAAAFAQIDDTWGSFDNYVHNGLQLTDADIAQLQATLLSPPEGV